MSMSALVALGAPELPDGYFYRITDTHIIGVKVEIRQQRRFGSRAMPDAYSYAENSNTGDAAGDVIGACHRACERWAAADERRALYTRTRAFIGDHDPKGGK